MANRALLRKCNLLCGHEHDCVIYKSKWVLMRCIGHGAFRYHTAAASHRGPPSIRIFAKTSTSATTRFYITATRSWILMGQPAPFYYQDSDENNAVVDHVGVAAWSAINH